MSAEQGDVEAIREALAQLDPFKTGRAFTALDRLAADRDEAWRAHELAMKAGLARGRRAEKAERALGEIREALEQIRLIDATSSYRSIYSCPTEMADIARDALRPSEDTSDES